MTSLLCLQSGNDQEYRRKNLQKPLQSYFIMRRTPYIYQRWGVGWPTIVWNTGIVEDIRSLNYAWETLEKCSEEIMVDIRVIVWTLTMPIAMQWDGEQKRWFLNRSTLGWRVNLITEWSMSRSVAIQILFSIPSETGPNSPKENSWLVQDWLLVLDTAGQLLIYVRMATVAS